MMRLFLLSVVAVSAAVDPLEILPPGVATGLSAMSEQSIYTLNLYSPGAASSDAVDAVFAGENSAATSREAAAVAAKQALLNNEVAAVHAMVGHRSFLRADYQINMHSAPESASDIDAYVNSLMKVESSRAQAAAASASSLKKALLAAEMARIHSIVAHGF